MAGRAAYGGAAGLGEGDGSAEKTLQTVLMNRGVVRQERGDFLAAAKQYERVLARNASHPGAHNNYGSCLWHLGWPEEALAAFGDDDEVEVGSIDASFIACDASVVGGDAEVFFLSIDAKLDTPVACAAAARLHRAGPSELDQCWWMCSCHSSRIRARVIRC